MQYFRSYPIFLIDSFSRIAFNFSAPGRPALGWELLCEIQFNYLFSAAEWLWDEWEDLACSYAHNKEQSFNTFKALNVHDLKNTIELIDGWLMASAMIYFPEKRKWAEIDEIVRAIIR